MDQLEATVQKNVVNLCKILPSHVENWKRLLAEAQKPTRALSNYAEQLRHVERANIKYIENFQELQEHLLFKIFSEFEEELDTIKNIVDQMSHSNHELKNKLSALERSTIDLNWERDSLLIKGDGLQPPLDRILQEGFVFWTIFSKAFRNISDNVRTLDVRKPEMMSKFIDSFKLDFECLEIRGLLAITQYVLNEKAVN